MRCDVVDLRPAELAGLEEAMEAADGEKAKVGAGRVDGGVGGDAITPGSRTTYRRSVATISAA
jgi:hypothetical protein